MTALLDTGFLLAVMDADDSLHAACTAALESESAPLLPDVVLPELAYLILRELGYPALTTFLRSVATGELIQVTTTPEDLSRAAEVLEKYADSRVDFVDCVIDLLGFSSHLEIARTPREYGESNLRIVFRTPSSI